MVNLQKVWESKAGRVCRVEVTADDTADIIGMSLQSGYNTLVRLEVTLPENAVDGEVYPIFVEQKINGDLTGRVTLLARTMRTPAYIANRNKRSMELHVANCKWTSKIAKRHKVPYNDLEVALLRGYDGCKYCLSEHHTR